MIDQFMQLVRQYGQESVVQNPGIPDEHNEGVLDEAGNTLMSSFERLAQSGKVNDVLASPEHPEVKNIESDFASNIIKKFGINNQVAASVASALIPAIIAGAGKMAKSYGIDLQSILGSPLGGLFKF